MKDPNYLVWVVLLLPWLKDMLEKNGKEGRIPLNMEGAKDRQNPAGIKQVKMTTTTEAATEALPSLLYVMLLLHGDGCHLDCFFTFTHLWKSLAESKILTSTHLSFSNL